MMLFKLVFETNRVPILELSSWTTVCIWAKEEGAPCNMLMQHLFT